MKFPKHILLDVTKLLISRSSQYWIIRYLFISLKNGQNFSDLTSHRKFFLKKENVYKNKIFQNQKLYTIAYNYSNPAIFFSEEQKKFYEIVYATRVKVKHRVIYSKHVGKEVYDYIMNPDAIFDEKSINRLIQNFDYKTTTSIFKTNLLWSLFDINFLKKEKMYTKLKYSRVPQYDIVSGGSAALFAGFLGFLICEKFGFELPDSGDFYYLFMYIVFLCFGCRPYLKLINSEKLSWNPLSFKWAVYFLQTLVILVLEFFKLKINFLKY